MAAQLGVTALLWWWVLVLIELTQSGVYILWEISGFVHHPSTYRLPPPYQGITLLYVTFHLPLLSALKPPYYHPTTTTLLPPYYHPTTTTLLPPYFYYSIITTITRPDYEATKQLSVQATPQTIHVQVTVRQIIVCTGYRSNKLHVSTGYWHQKRFGVQATK